MGIVIVLAGVLSPAWGHQLPSLSDPQLLAPLIDAQVDDQGPEIEIVVVGPGDQFYSLYGHLAVLVWTGKSRQPEDGHLFNFGMTDFRKEGYLSDFAGGRVKFWGGQQKYAKYLRLWTKNDRTITRYPLNLQPRVARALHAQLRHDIKPAHKYFTYDTFRSNCSTRVRDMLDTYTGGALYRALATTPTEQSYRDDIRRAYSKRPGLLWLTEWFLGYTTDQARTPWELSYRPVYFGDVLNRVRHIDGSPLIKPSIVDHERVGSDPTDGWYQWLATFTLLLAGILCFGALRRTRLSHRQHSMIVLALGVPLIGLSVGHLGLQLLSHWVDARNCLLLLAVCPIDFIVVLGFGQSIKRKHPISEALRYYIQVRLVIATAILLLALIDFGAGPVAPRVLVASWWLFALRQPNAHSTDLDHHSVSPNTEIA